MDRRCEGVCGQLVRLDVEGVDPLEVFDIPCKDGLFVNECSCPNNRVAHATGIAIRRQLPVDPACLFHHCVVSRVHWF